MAITRAEFKKAFREVVSQEFAHIPTDENSIDYTFSERFNKRMEKLIKAQKKAYWQFVNTASKRAAIIVLVIATMFSAAFGVKAIREPIVNFIKQVYETFIHYSFDGDTRDTIEKEYSITYLPDGFEETNKIKNECLIITTYETSSGELIKFSQRTTQNHSGVFDDNENTVVSNVVINLLEIELKEWLDTKCAIWSYDGYFFMLDCYGEIDFDVIKEIIKSIK